MFGSHIPPRQKKRCSTGSSWLQNMKKVWTNRCSYCSMIWNARKSITSRSIPPCERQWGWQRCWQIRWLVKEAQPLGPSQTVKGNKLTATPSASTLYLLAGSICGRWLGWLVFGRENLTEIMNSCSKSQSHIVKRPPSESRGQQSFEGVFFRCQMISIVILCQLRSVYKPCSVRT